MSNISTSHISSKTTLDLIESGTTVLIRSINSANSLLYRKLLIMGLTSGRAVTVVRKAPFGDPIAITLLGSMLSLRLSEAQAIEVERLVG